MQEPGHHFADCRKQTDQAMRFHTNDSRAREAYSIFTMLPESHGTLICANACFWALCLAGR